MNLPHHMIIALITGACLLAIPADGRAAQKAGSAPLSGSWRGAGLVQAENGQQERVKCRAHYTASGQDRYQVRMKCVSRTKGSRSRVFTVRKSGSLMFSGRFQDPEANIGISAAIRLKGHRQVIEIRSKKGWGRFEMKRKK